MVPLMMLSLLCATDASPSGVMQHQHKYKWHPVMLVLISMVQQDQKSHAAPHFDCLYLRNAMVPLVIQLALHDAAASTGGTTEPKCHGAPLFDCLSLM